ncbi:MAG: FAD binding domain-containing protein [Alphaproteobacteria bacterium]|nr:FAD binding domain-containing protein [Alphaproteobacteria bacterium]
MKAASFDYARPRDLGEATRLLAQAAGAAKALAGGQSLGPMLNLRLARPALLVDIARLESLHAIADGGDHWLIGAGVTHARLEDASGALPGAEMLCHVAHGIAYRAVRNRGTVGGSLAHADPAADWPLALAALDATAEIAGPKFARRTPVAALMTGAFTTVLADDELIVSVAVPKASPQARWGYYKFCRKPGEFPDASAAVVLDPARKVARLYAGALDGPPQALPALAAAAAAGTVPSLDDIEAALAPVARGLDDIDRRLHAVAVQRALKQAIAR